MTNGLNLEEFKLGRIETPMWVDQKCTFAHDMTDEAKAQLAEQESEILGLVEDTLRWALTDPDAIKQLQHMYSYSEKVHGDYFIGRRLSELKSDEVVVIEMECCLTSLDYKSGPSIYQGYIITLEWNLETVSGRRMLAHNNPRDSLLSRLDLRLFGRTPEFLEVLNTKSEDQKTEWQRWMIDHWQEVLKCIQFHAEEEVRAASSSGELDFEFFPCRLSMTGEYYIEELSALKMMEYDHGFCVMLHFLGHPFIADMIDEPFFNYLGYELVIVFDHEGQSHLHYSGSSVI